MIPKPVFQKLCWTLNSQPWMVAFWSELVGVLIWKFRRGSSGKARIKRCQALSDRLTTEAGKWSRMYLRMSPAAAPVPKAPSAAR